MAFVWRVDPPVDEATRDDLGLDEAFPTRDDAQAWLSTVWPELVDAGVEQVTMVDGDTPVYTMSLNDE